MGILANEFNRFSREVFCFDPAFGCFVIFLSCPAEVIEFFENFARIRGTTGIGVKLSRMIAYPEQTEMRF
jgi:hypothetical protein